MDDANVVCTAMNAGVLDGLITVFHTERSADSLANLQNDLPILCPEDKAALEVRRRRGFGRLLRSATLDIKLTRAKAHNSQHWGHRMCDTC